MAAAPPAGRRPRHGGARSCGRAPRWPPSRPARSGASGGGARRRCRARRPTCCSRPRRRWPRRLRWRARATPRSPRARTRLFNLLSSFVGTFIAARGITYLLRNQPHVGPFRNVRVGRRHIHHFVPGIVIAFAAGAAAILTRDEDLEPKLAVPFGVGMGLTLDESALLLELEDVYWTREGLLSVQITLAVTALLASLALGLRFLRRGSRPCCRLNRWFDGRHGKRIDSPPRAPRRPTRRSRTGPRRRRAAGSSRSPRRRGGRASSWPRGGRGSAPPCWTG